MPPVSAVVQSVSNVSVYVLALRDALIPSKNPNPQTHNQKSHTACHMQKPTVQKGMHMQLLDSIPAWLLAAVCVKSLPGVHSQPWTQEEGWEGDNFKSKHRAYADLVLYICRARCKTKTFRAADRSSRLHPS